MYKKNKEWKEKKIKDEGLIQSFIKNQVNYTNDCIS